MIACPGHALQFGNEAGCPIILLEGTLLSLHLCVAMIGWGTNWDIFLNKLVQAHYQGRYYREVRYPLRLDSSSSSEED